MSGWYFDNVWKIDYTSHDVKIIDGHIWATDGTKVTVWNIWGDINDKKDVERAEITNLSKNDFREAVKVAEFTVENGAYGLVDAGDKVWITNAQMPVSMISVKKDFSNVESDVLHSGISVVKFPKQMWSDVIYAYGKLWMVDIAVLPEPQYMHTYDGSVWTETLIPVKPQESIIRIADGKNGFVYATSFNNVGVSKFASSTAAFIGLVRVNAEPSAIISSDSGIFVASYAGMVSKIDRTNDVVTHPYSSFHLSGELVDTGDGYIWSLNYDGTGFVRIKTSDLSVIYTGATNPDFTFETSDFTGNKVFNRILATSTVPMIYWDGSAMQTATAHQRLVLVSNSNIYIIRNYGSLNRKPYTQLSAYGYITTGPYDYAGD